MFYSKCYSMRHFGLCMYTLDTQEDFGFFANVCTCGFRSMAWNGFLYTRCDWLLCVWFGGVCVCCSQVYKGVQLWAGESFCDENPFVFLPCCHNRVGTQQVCVLPITGITDHLQRSVWVHFIQSSTRHTYRLVTRTSSSVHTPPDRYVLEQEKARGKQLLVSVEWKLPPVSPKTYCVIVGVHRALEMTKLLLLID